MTTSARLLTLVAVACSRRRLLSPLTRWALRKLRKATRPPVGGRARARVIVRRGRPTAAVKRAGPRRDGGGWRRSSSLDPRPG